MKTSKKIRQKNCISSRENFIKTPYNTTKPCLIAETGLRTLNEKMAASYSPALHCSTIGAGGLNFSVRNGKRWDPAAIAT